MPHVLVVDDEAHMRQLIRIYLESSAFAVTEAGTGAEAIAAVQGETVDLVVLDVMMPEMDGWETCVKLRSIFPELPILMLTARTAIEDRVAGLGMGADDYLTKPFDGRELVARVQSLLRRTHATDSRVLRISTTGIAIDAEGRTVRVHDRELPFTPKEFEVLFLLAKRPGRTFTRDELLERIWGQDYFGDTRTVDSHIKKIREKLRDAGVMDDPIATVWGMGYKLEVKP